jgi:hypothetical protein
MGRYRGFFYVYKYNCVNNVHYYESQSYIILKKEEYLMKCLIRWKLIFVLALVVSSFIGFTGWVYAEVSMAEPGKSDLTSKLTVNENYGKLPLSFIRNDGQIDEKVKFYEKGSGHSMYFTNESIYLELVGSKKEDLKDSDVNSETSNQAHINQNFHVETIKLSPVGANKNPEIVVEGMQNGKVNYLIGNDPEKWKTDIPTYGAVLYKNIYKDIDIKYYGNNRRMEYDVIVKPGADYSQVQFSYDGIKGLKIRDDGKMEVAFKQGNVIQSRPYCYQEINGKKVDVDGSFKLVKTQSKSSDAELYAYAFDISTYDKDYSLIIDPFLEYSTLIEGTSGISSVNAIAVDSAGNTYVAGQTPSADFPTTQGAYDEAFNGPTTDAFISKLSPDGSGLIYSTYLGGSTVNSFNSDHDSASDIAVDSTGSAYIIGRTLSSDFPTTPGAFRTTFVENNHSFTNFFVTKLLPDGSGLEYSTFLGETYIGTGAIAIDTEGNAYLTASTTSFNFPTTPGAFDTTHNGKPANDPNYGKSDVFVTKLNSDGSTLIYSTFIGGLEVEYANAIAVDSSGSAYVGGTTNSARVELGDPEVLYPTTPGAFDTVPDFSYKAFVTKLSPDGSSLVYSTFLGGIEQGENVTGIAVDSLGSAYVAGFAGASDFPITSGVFDTSYNGEFGELFVTKFTPDGSQLVYSTFLGGSRREDPNVNLAIDSLGNAYVVGATSSVDFPTTPDAFDASYNNIPGDGYEGDAFFTVVNSDGTGLVYSTYIGGGKQDWCTGIALDTFENAYVAGRTGSNSFPITPGAFDGNLDNHQAPFVLKFNLGTSLNHPPTGSAGLDQQVYLGDTATLDGSLSFDVDGDPLLYNWVIDLAPNDSSASITNPTSIYPSFTPDIRGSYTISLTVNDGTSNSSPDTMAVIALNADNQKPVANAGPDRNLLLGETATISGYESFDPDGDTIVSYTWALDSVPAGSTASLYNTASSSTVIKPDVVGDYVISLVVNDWQENSLPDTITIHAYEGTPPPPPNQPPTARGFPNKGSIFLGETVTFDGSRSSDPDGDDIVSYNWFIRVEPAGSHATIVNPTSIYPTITATEVGTYGTSLVVYDGDLYSEVSNNGFYVMDPTIQPNDEDVDSILDSVDQAPFSYGNYFQDIWRGGMTSGRIDLRGDRTWLIEDDNTGGVKITVSAGAEPARIAGSCSPTTWLDIPLTGGEYLFACGSSTVHVISGSLVYTTTTLDGQVVAVTVDTGGGVTLDDTVILGELQVTNVGATALDVEVDGVVNLLEVGGEGLAVDINLPPVASADGPFMGAEGYMIDMDASTSYDPADGLPLTYSWGFGDGQSIVTNDAVVTHVYVSAGTYPVTLVVNDGVLDSEAFSTEATIKNITSIMSGGGQRSDVDAFLSYTRPTAKSVSLPAGTTSYDMEIAYGIDIQQGTFQATLNGNPVGGFSPVPNTWEVVEIPLSQGRNVLILGVKGTRTDGRTATDKDRLVFIVE